MDRPVEDMRLGEKASAFKVNEDLYPGSRPAKNYVKAVHEYLQSCFPRHDEGALYEVALTIWRMSKGF